MPFGVTAWPYHPDPRSSHFSLLGYSFGQVPPYRFKLITEGAQPPWDDLNGGILVTFNLQEGDQTEYIDPTSRYRVHKLGFADTQPVPTPHTVKLTVVCLDVAPPVYQGDLLLLSPDAIQPRSVIVVPDPSEPSRIPNPVEILPRRWNQGL